MRTLPCLLLTCGLSLAAFAIPATAADAPPPGGNPGARDRPPRPDGPPPGGVHFIPRFVVDKLNLTDDQKKQIADLEQETKAKLDKILTPEQRKILEETRPPRGGGDRGPRRDGDQGGPRGEQDGGPRPPRNGGDRGPKGPPAE